MAKGGDSSGSRRQESQRQPDRSAAGDSWPGDASLVPRRSIGDEPTHHSQTDSSLSDAGTPAAPQLAGGDTDDLESRYRIQRELGRGGMATLEEALRQVAPTGRIRLLAGTHRLQQPLEIDQSVALIGQGMDRTRIECDGPGFVVNFAAGTSSARNITFAHCGEAEANVVEVNAQQLTLEQCRFEGGKRSDNDGDVIAGHGLYLRGTTRAVVRKCEAVSNDCHGIAVADQSEATLDSNTCQQNRLCGIAYSDSASGTARGNTCEGNEVDGILVGQQAQPTLEQNTCRQNKLCGIAYFGSASGTARENTCEGNRKLQIYVAGSATPNLVANVGIVFSEKKAIGAISGGGIGLLIGGLIGGETGGLIGSFIGGGIGWLIGRVN
jgi:parallel beta-helix repeat protein